ncbi:thermostable hemolysin [Aestuariibacter halophilus]|uniref:Thermostable hemolysin n=1 Tax=Fluctibacter halophilus TaxID=226011 RepID=A0ABS8G919_9ALTE|nr:thermostable hemolysin [Aestuariibacter halophilus]MCC2617084.1 thermostable hemolysin [Aestuariibacter halophilus]
MFQAIADTGTLQTRQPAVEQRPALRVSAVTALSKRKKDVETFVKQGFARHYNADIHHFLPVMVFAQGHAIQAALGVRSARQGLFVEQYMPDNVEQTLAQHGIDAQAEQVAEIGNLHSRSSAYTLPLLLVTGMALHQAGIEHLVFCATPKVARLLERRGLSLVRLCPADPRKLLPSDDHWGSYYDSNPQVIALDLAQVKRTIDHSLELTSLYKLLKQDVAAVYQQLRCLA